MRSRAAANKCGRSYRSPYKGRTSAIRAELVRTRPLCLNPLGTPQSRGPTTREGVGRDAHRCPLGAPRRHFGAYRHRVVRRDIGAEPQKRGLGTARRLCTHVRAPKLAS